MKKITFFIVALFATQIMQSQTVLSQSTSQIVVDGSVACANGAGGFTTENNYTRSYIPSAHGESGAISIKGGEFGYSFTDNSGGNDPQVNVLVTASSTDAPYPTGTLTLLTQATVVINAAGDLTVVAFDFDDQVNIDADDEIVVTVSFPDGSVEVYDSRIGQNQDGETAPSYISTDVSCGPIVPTTFTDIGFPGNAIINLTVDAEVASVDDLAIFNFSYGPNPVNNTLNLKAQENITDISLINLLGQKVIDIKPNLTNVEIDISKLDNGTYFVKARINNNIGTFKIVKK